MKIAIIGSSGYLASHIFLRMKEESKIKRILKLGRGEDCGAYLDLQKAEEFNYSLLEDIDYIVFTAAISGPDQCAREYDYCWKTNVIGTSYFIREAIKKNCRVLFFSSDAVFGDIQGKIYDEESETEAHTPYGKMKKAIEDEFSVNPLFKAIRLSYVASAQDRFITYCFKCMQSGAVANIFHPFYRNVITISDVVHVVTYFAIHWDEYEPTFLNVAGKELVSRIRIADELNRYFGGKLKYLVSMPGEEFFVNRPRITQMKSLYMQKYRIIEDNTFTEKIVKELEELQK